MVVVVVVGDITVVVVVEEVVEMDACTVLGEALLVDDTPVVTSTKEKVRVRETPLGLVKEHHKTVQQIYSK